jgi:hypothetical protein
MPKPLVLILARGGAKSTSAEMTCALWGARRQRRYVWYVSETQSQANDHVQNIATLLESQAFSAQYPKLSDKRVNKFGDQRAWRQNRIWTADGFVVDALGLDTASRGIKLEEQRPDAMIFDDLDRQTDGPEIVAKKIRTMTRSILPAGTDDLAVFAIQNLIHGDGIFARLAGVSKESADFLADRIVSGPHPAIHNPAYEQRDGRWHIVSGTPSWQGQDLAACQRIISRDGLSSFKVECQHEVDLFEGGLFANIVFRYCRMHEVPDLVRTLPLWLATIHPSKVRTSCGGPPTGSPTPSGAGASSPSSAPPDPPSPPECGPPASWTARPNLTQTRPGSPFGLRRPPRAGRVAGCR